MALTSREIDLGHETMKSPFLICLEQKMSFEFDFRLVVLAGGKLESQITPTQRAGHPRPIWKKSDPSS